ncbi:MAG TPA: sugar ABC transporter permease [Devosiaceae bacterium]|jgi:multiple sugar transport system permease protein
MTQITTAEFPGKAERARLAFNRPSFRSFQWQPWLYLAPTLIILAVWIYIPLVQEFQISFVRWNMLPTAPQVFVGLDNYRQLIALPEMQRALINTVIYIAGLFPLSVFIPLGIAIFTQNLDGKLRNFYRAIIFVPMIIAPVVAGIVWRWLLAQDHGLINQFLTGLGLGPVGFLEDPNWAMPTLIWITGWKLIGFSTLLLAAANASINPTYIEAAQLDGANSWEVVRDIRLPLLSPTILLLSMMTILLGAQWSFIYINILTGGGPLKSTTNIFYLLYQYGFASMTAGWSAAAGIMTFVGFGIVAFACLWIIRKRAVYDN